MRIYTWKNRLTGGTEDTLSYDEPPCVTGVECNCDPEGECEWQRVFLFGLGSVSGAGGSPVRTSSSKK